MKVDIVRIGRGWGIRLPRALLDRLGFGKEAELEVRGDLILLRPSTASRQGWEAAFAADPTPHSPEPWPDSLAAEADRDWIW